MKSAVIAMTGQKGGTGKTTLTAQLTGEFTLRGRKTLALDADPQQSLFDWSRAGDAALSVLVKPLEAENAREFARSVAELGKGFDLILIDTPPGITDAARWSLAVADLAAIPTGPSPLDIKASADLIGVVRAVSAERKGKPKVALIPNRVRAGTALGRDVAEALAELGPVSPPVGLREAQVSASLEGLTLAEHCPPSHAARKEIVALADFLERIL